MNYTDIRNIIISGLYKDLEVIVVPTDTNAPKPEYPFLSYKFTTIFRSDAKNKLYKTIPSIYEQFEYDVGVTVAQQPQMILSISSYSLDDGESADLANQARKWFELEGRQYLKDNGIIVVDITNIQDRTIQIVDNFEVRFGFDVRIRVYDETKTRIESIEKVNINIKEEY